MSASSGPAHGAAVTRDQPLAGVQLPAPVSQQAVPYTPNVYAGGDCSTYCPTPTILGIAVVNGEAVVVGQFGQVCTPAPGATYAPCPDNVNADFVFAFNLSNGQIDPGFTPTFDTGPVNAVVAGPGNTVYIGGSFGAVDGLKHTNVAQLIVDPGQPDDGQLVPGFTARADGAVNALAFNGNALYLAGGFGTVDGQPANVARVNATTGAFDSSFQMTLSDPTAGRNVKVKTLALSPDGTQLAIAGTFQQVNSQPAPRLALISTGGALGATATVDNWEAPILATRCLHQTSWINGIDFSPDGSYLVIADSGYKTAGGPALCDAAARFPTGVTGSVQPTWINFSGADSLDTVAIVGSVVYIGGHNRWFNNECGTNVVCEPNAVLQDGLSALDANTGLTLPWWHPQTARGPGLYALTPFPAGAFPGSDGGLLVGMGVNNIGGAAHNFLAMFPETTTAAPVPGGPVRSGIWSDGRPGVQEEGGSSSGVAAECMDDTGNSTTPGTAVELVTCSNDNEQNWTVNPAGTIGVNGLCLDEAGSVSGSGLVLNTCSGTTSQNWQQDSGNTVVNQASGLCLDDPNASTTSGTKLDVATCSGQVQQSWPLPVAQAPPPPPPTGPLYSQLVNKDNVPCLKYDGASVSLAKCTGAADQNWTAQATGAIQANSLCLDTQGEGTTSPTPVVLAACNGSPTQGWTYKPTSSFLVNNASGLCLYISSASFGTQPEVVTCNNTTRTGEQWRMPTY